MRGLGWERWGVPIHTRSPHHLQSSGLPAGGTQVWTRPQVPSGHVGGTGFSPLLVTRWGCPCRPRPQAPKPLTTWECGALALAWRVSCPHVSPDSAPCCQHDRGAWPVGLLVRSYNVISWEGLQGLWSWREVFLPIPDLPAAPWEQAVSLETLAVSQGEIGWDHCP